MVRKHYQMEGATSGPTQLVEFEKDMITLDIDLEGVPVSVDWKLMPLMHPAVSIVSNLIPY